MMKSIALFASLINPPFDPQSTNHSVLDRIAIVESGGPIVGQWAVGGRGASRGPWQMKRAAWEDVDRKRVKAGFASLDWHGFSHNPISSRTYAADYLEILRTQFIAAKGRAPDDFQIYAMWCLGLSGSKKRGFSTHDLPPRIQAKIDKFRATK